MGFGIYHQYTFTTCVHEPLTFSMQVDWLVYLHTKASDISPPPVCCSSLSREWHECGCHWPTVTPHALVHQDQMCPAAVQHSRMRSRDQLAADCHMMLWCVSRRFPSRTAIGWAASVHMFTRTYICKFTRTWDISILPNSAIFINYKKRHPGRLSKQGVFN